MHIAVVGGRHHNPGQLARIARAAGHELELAQGAPWGPGLDGIRVAIARAHLVLVVLDGSSHRVVQLAKAVARQRQRPLWVLESFGAARLCRLLDVLERRRHATEQRAEPRSADPHRLASTSVAEGP